MRIAIIGTGNMANALTKTLGKKHEVVIYGRDEEEANNLASTYKEQAKKLEDNIDEEIVILAVPYDSLADVLREHAKSLENKTLVDISNPMNWQTLELREGEGALKTVGLIPAGANLIKAFNTIPAEYLEKGEVDGKPVDVFLAGDNEEAKEKLVSVINDSGLRAIDIGPLSFAPYLESLLLINARSGAKVGNGSQTSIKILQ